MPSRQERAVLTREHLVDTGLALAEETGLAGMSVNLIVEAAGVAKGTFFHHFEGRATFLAALHREFHDQLFTAITRSVAGTPHGRDRLLAATEAYLDHCLRHRGIRALLLEARAEPLVADAIAERNRQACRFLTPDFAAMGWPHPADGAALWNGLVVEAALLELAHRSRRPTTRETLAHFLTR
ncbi:TetR/AcrR family transcriptional regulator [Frankia sp. AgPm24]|uniref:TetR/AcrR family transcriptional regulator n=1 Tax=Frankia sp. AgPm24 TaxID=631128 RepID=UPI00200C50D0|nr:TetR/AcrR family transcriptional regulator [Frankia sp. AgPm24]MCK9921858.1 TetR/AcrR family transcriptional regulator [Frankia sp. AgPm24]